MLQPGPWTDTRPSAFHDSTVEANPAMLNEVLERALRLAKHDYLVTVISDFDGVDEPGPLLDDRELYSGFETTLNLFVNYVFGLRQMDEAAANVLAALATTH